MFKVGDVIRVKDASYLEYGINEGFEGVIVDILKNVKGDLLAFPYSVEFDGYPEPQLMLEEEMELAHDQV